MAIEFRDPATGKIKPVYLIAGIGIGGLALFLLLGRSNGGGTTFGGQSGENTDALAGLQDAIGNLAGGGGGGSSTTAGTASSGGGGSSSGSGGDGFSSAPSSADAGYTNDIPLGDSNVAPSVGNPYNSRISVPGGETMTPINSYPTAANTPQALSKPSNSGLSSAPVVYNADTSSVAQTPGAVLPVKSGAGPKSIAYKPSGGTNTPIITTGTPSSNNGPKSIAYKSGTIKTAVTKVTSTIISPKSVATKAGTVITTSKKTTVSSTATAPTKQPVSTGGKKNPSATI